MRLKEIVKFQVEYANTQLARKGSFFSDAEEMDYKMGIIAMIENLLHTVGKYEGFMFVDNEDCACNTPGHLSRKYFFHW